MTTQPTRAAGFTNGSKARSATVAFNWIGNGERRHVETRPVSGKREARKMAAVMG